MRSSFTQKFVFHMLLFPTLGACFVFVRWLISLRLKHIKFIPPKFTNESIKTRAYKLASLTVFGLYAGLSTRIFLLFKCKKVQDHYYLTSDYRIKCYEGVWWNYGGVAILCILIYVLGIPIMQFVLLIKNRKHLHLSQSTDMKAHRIVHKKFGEIYKHYTEDCFYFELIDLTRRLILTGGLILIGEHSVVQVLLGIITALVWFTLVALNFPYKAFWDNVLQLVLSFGLLLSMISGLALKLYVLEKQISRKKVIAAKSFDDTLEQKIFDVLLVGMCIICICIGCFSLLVTLPWGKQHFAKYFIHLGKSKRSEMMRWVERQNVLLKWLDMEEVKKTLDKAERSLKASMRKAINEDNKLKRAMSIKGENSSSVRVYPISVVARAYKKKPSLADLAKVKMAAETRQRRRKLRRLMLPTTLSKSKWKDTSTKKITRSISAGLSIARKGREKQSVRSEVHRIEETLDASNKRRRKSITMMETRRQSLRMRVSRRKSVGQSKQTLPQAKDDKSPISVGSSSDSDIFSVEDSDDSI